MTGYRVPAPDLLSDSGSHKLGTRVRMHMPDGTLDVSLLQIRDCFSWSDLVLRVHKHIPIEITTPRVALAGGVVRWVEVLDDRED